MCEWCEPGGVLDAGGERASFRMYVDDPGAAPATRSSKPVLAEQSGIDRDSRHDGIVEYDSESG